MKIILLFCLLLVQTVTLFSQTTISGNMRDKKGESVPGANIYFEGTFEGTVGFPRGYNS
jgi:hypothetical protein